MDEYIVERDIDGMPTKLSAASFGTQQHHILCVNEADANDYHSEQIEIHEYDELEEEEEENETSTARSELDRSQTSAAITSVESHHSTVQSKPSTSSQSHGNASDERFLLSCLPNLQRLSNKKNQLARLKIQQLLYDIEFNDDNS